MRLARGAITMFRLESTPFSSHESPFNNLTELNYLLNMLELNRCARHSH